MDTTDVEKPACFVPHGGSQRPSDRDGGGAADITHFGNRQTNDASRTLCRFYASCRYSECEYGQDINRFARQCGEQSLDSAGRRLANGFPDRAMGKQNAILPASHAPSCTSEHLIGRSACANDTRPIDFASVVTDFTGHSAHGISIYDDTLVELRLFLHLYVWLAHCRSKKDHPIAGVRIILPSGKPRPASAAAVINRFHALVPGTLHALVTAYLGVFHPSAGSMQNGAGRLDA